MKSYYSLGLMSGTSGDGVDASIIQSDGDTEYKVILDKYFRYSQAIYENIHNLKDKINNSKDLKNLSKEVDSLEKEITLFHARVVDEIIKVSKVNIDFVGFHGQTIFHNPKEKISRQLGDGRLLSQQTKKTVVYNFRQNDLKNGGQGAPLTPIFHKLMIKKYKLGVPSIILNIGGIANATAIEFDQTTKGIDVGPGNCIIDQWVRLNSKKKYDENGNIAKSGKINQKIFKNCLDGSNDFLEKISKRISEDQTHSIHLTALDTKDYDISYFKGLSLEDGAATITAITADLIAKSLGLILFDGSDNIIVSGGGRKNNFLLETIAEKIKLKRTSLSKLRAPQRPVTLKLIDDYGIDGDFVESQAFAYLSIRCYLKLPISFPSTTGVIEPCTGGVIVKN